VDSLAFFYQKIATKHGTNHAEVTDFHCLLWLANLVQPCWFVRKQPSKGEFSRLFSSFVVPGVPGCSLHGVADYRK
jgi:hypothetical protein